MDKSKEFEDFFVKLSERSTMKKPNPFLSYGIAIVDGLILGVGVMFMMYGTISLIVDIIKNV